MDGEFKCGTENLTPQCFRVMTLYSLCKRRFAPNMHQFSPPNLRRLVLRPSLQLTSQDISDFQTIRCRIGVIKCPEHALACYVDDKSSST